MKRLTILPTVSPAGRRNRLVASEEREDGGDAGDAGNAQAAIIAQLKQLDATNILEGARCEIRKINIPSSSRSLS